tara:strand:+ start:131 stop:313 length:183 start_codon:yes stop_codon:yes gene_type:complete
VNQKKHYLLPLAACLVFFVGLVLGATTGCNGPDPENTSARPWADPGGVPGILGGGDRRRR